MKIQNYYTGSELAFGKLCKLFSLKETVAGGSRLKINTKEDKNMSIKKINLLTKVYLDTKPDATAGEVARFIKDVEITLKIVEKKNA